MSRITSLFLIMVIYLFYESHTRSMEVNFERAEISYINPKYIGENATVNVRRSSRRGQYVVNFSGYNKQTWANNVTVTIHLYEYLHNEYRPSFVEASYKLCDFINKDIYGQLVKKFGIECPLHKKFWIVSNTTISVPSFPYVFPFSKCKAELLLKRIVPSEEIMGRWHIYMTIKQT